MRKLIRVLFLVFVLGSFYNACATKITQNLFINRGTLTTVKGGTFPFLAFNSSTAYNSLNTVISCLKNDTLVINVTNNDTTLHGFKVKNYAGIEFTITPTSSISCTLVPVQRAAFAYYDHIAYPKNRYLGLAGMIVVKEKTNDKVYFWNLKDHQSTYNQQLASGAAVNWNNYYPDFFTINGKSFSDLQSDPTAKIQNQVNDTIYIYVLNSGQAMHSLHFHGFHTKAVHADCKRIKQNWVKDTWGLFSMDVMVMQMIPDKKGKYSVHDHNLVAVTGGNTHPNGMFTIMDITP